MRLSVIPVILLLTVPLIFFAPQATHAATVVHGTVDGVNFTEYQNITYCSNGGVAEKLDLYFPSNAAKPAPLAVFIHGGGWTSGDKSGIQPWFLGGMLANGFFVASVNYRLAPAYRFPAQIQDAMCSIRFLKAHSSVLGFNGSRISAFGVSSGGHLGLLLATPTGEPSAWITGGYSTYSSSVRDVADLSGPTNLTGTDFGAAAALAISETFPPSQVAPGSPVTYAPFDTNPVLMVYGMNDTMVPLSQATEYSNLIPAGLGTSLLVDCAGHGIYPIPGCTENPPRSTDESMIVGFLVSNGK